MKDHLLAFLNAAEYFDLKLAPVADFNIPPSGHAGFNNEDAPFIAVAKQGAQGDLQHIFAFPDNDPGFYTVSVAERARGVHEIRDEIIAPLRGYTRQAEAAAE